MRFVRRLPDATSSSSAALSYARASLIVREEPEEAIRWFLRAHALVDQREALLLGRISRDLGALHLRRGEAAAADAVLKWSEGRPGAPQRPLGDVSLCLQNPGLTVVGQASMRIGRCGRAK